MRHILWVAKVGVFVLLCFLTGTSRLLSQSDQDKERVYHPSLIKVIATRLTLIAGV
jgi:hypothetical protein